MNINQENGRIQYLTEILPEIPTNTILYKKLTGLGATYGELKANRNSVIIEPNKPVIVGKCNDPKHSMDNLFGVYEGVYTDKIIAYIEKSIREKKHIKILTTPESFRKVQDAFEAMEMDMRFECFLLFDECHKIVKDVDYRANIILPMDFSLNASIRRWFQLLLSVSQTRFLKNRSSKLLPSTRLSIIQKT